MTRITRSRISAVAVAGVLVAAGGTAASRAGGPPAPVMATTEYSHGDPTDQEQYFLELMNRARLDPSGEADRILVDYDDAVVRKSVSTFLRQRPKLEFTRQENHDAFDALPAVQPLAFHAAILTAARKHSAVMRIVDAQVHQVTGELGIKERVEAEGYDALGVSESLFAYSKGMLHAHAGFAVDWGQEIDADTGRPETGHRDLLMSADFVECGLGVALDDDPSTTVGPELLTVDFAVPQDTTMRFVTGVVFEDANGNGFYDPGEGIPGVRIESDASDFYAISSSSGGYAVPVPSFAGAATVVATGTPATAGAGIGVQEVQVTLDGRNVKVDFVPRPPDGTTIAGGTQLAIGDGAGLADAVLVGALSPADTTVGDIDVSIALDHGDRSELRVTLESPLGTEVVLFDGGPGGSDLRGDFDGSLFPAEALSAFVGEPYQGVWTLLVEEAAGGVAGGTLESWSLSIRPGWVRAVHAPPSQLVVGALKVKDSSQAGRDKLSLKADLDVDGALLDANATIVLRLLDAGTGDELFSVPLTEPPPEGPTVKARVDLNRGGSSRGSIVAKVSGFDLSAPLPDPAVLRVELAVGDAILAEELQASRGKATSAATPRFAIGSIKSKAKGTLRSTVVKGHFSPGAGLGALTGVSEFGAGDAVFRFDSSALVAKGSKRVYKSAGGLRLLVLDEAKGTFSAKIQRRGELLEDGKATFRLRLGDALYRTAVVRPVVNGTKTVY